MSNKISLRSPKNLVRFEENMNKFLINLFTIYLPKPSATSVMRHKVRFWRILKGFNSEFYFQQLTNA